ncbi:DHS-like NAD/FAD-binding domain-containing protein [Dipodascopsis uninucleata]
MGTPTEQTMSTSQMELNSTTLDKEQHDTNSEQIQTGTISDNIVIDPPKELMKYNGKTKSLESNEDLKAKPKKRARKAPAKRGSASVANRSGKRKRLVSFEPYQCKTQILSEAFMSTPEADHIRYAFSRAKRLVVVVGAGISVQAGIPDFRSPSGIFKTVKDSFKLKGSGQSMFDVSVYHSENSIRMFHQMVNSLHSLSKDATTTSFHSLLGKLAQENRLLRLYTQNVDSLESSLSGLETIAPLPAKAPWPKTIQLHGSLEKMICSKCGYISAFDPLIFNDNPAPECPECKELDSVREVVGKRTQGVGIMRPRIVLYNEYNPDSEAIGSVTAADLKSRPDGLLVVGTSLKVPGVKRIVREMSLAVHAIKGLVVWVNHDPPPAPLQSCFDYDIRGDCQLLPTLLNNGDVGSTAILHSSKGDVKNRFSEATTTVPIVQAEDKGDKQPKQTKITDIFKVKKESHPPESSLTSQSMSSIKDQKHKETFTS